MSKIRVALIEDHDLVRIAIRQGLRQQPEIEFVGEAANVKEGLKLLLSQAPDVAIVDIDLPDGSGIDIVKQLKQAQANQQAANVKALMLTFRDSREVVEAAFAAGATSYCLKQVSTDDLIKAIQMTYQGQRWLDPAVASFLPEQP